MTSLLPDPGEYLTDGWEPDLDPADSIVRQAIEVHVSWAKALTTAARGPWRETPAWAAGSGGATTAMLNHVIVRQSKADWTEIAEGIGTAYPDTAGVIVLSPFPAPDLSDLGLALVGHPPLMMRPVATTTTEPATTLQVREARAPEELQDAERVLVEGYPMPDLAHLPRGEFYRPEVVDARTRVFVGYDRDTALATSVAHSAAGVTIVENVAVLGEARGRGAGAAITWAATRAWPDQPAVLIASDAGQPVYERLGFLRLVRWTCWLRPGRGSRPA
jgi:hypothetical protein